MTGKRVTVSLFVRAGQYVTPQGDTQRHADPGAAGSALRRYPSRQRPQASSIERTAITDRQASPSFIAPSAPH